MNRLMTEKNKRKAIIGMIVLLLAATAILAGLNLYNSKASLESFQTAKIRISRDEGQPVWMDLDFLKAIGPTTFDASITKKVGDPIPHSFTGVPMSAVLLAAGFGVEPGQSVTLTCVDNYTVTLTAEEVSDPDNVYLIYGMDGKTLTADDGFGPYMTVIRKDSGSTRWARQLTGIGIAPARGRQP